MWTFLGTAWSPSGDYFWSPEQSSVELCQTFNTRLNLPFPIPQGGFLFWWSSKLPSCYSFSTDFDKNCFCLCGYFFRLQWEFIYFFGNQIWIEMCYNHLVIFIVFFRDTPLLMAIGPNGTNHDKFCNQWTNCNENLISKTFLNKNPPCWHSALPQAHHHPWKEGHPWWESSQLFDLSRKDGFWDLTLVRNETSRPCLFLPNILKATKFAESAFQPQKCVDKILRQ